MSMRSTALNRSLKRIYKNESKLQMVLEHPEIPLLTKSGYQDGIYIFCIRIDTFGNAAQHGPQHRGPQNDGDLIGKAIHEAMLAEVVYELTGETLTAPKPIAED